MSLTTLIAVSIALMFTQSEIIKQIMIILLIGLIVDLINTWIQNVGILRLYLERKAKKQAKKETQQLAHAQRNQQKQDKVKIDTLKKAIREEVKINPPKQPTKQPTKHINPRQAQHPVITVVCAPSRVGVSTLCEWRLVLRNRTKQISTQRRENVTEWRCSAPQPGPCPTL